MPYVSNCRHCPEPLTTDIERAYGEHVGCDRPPAARVGKPAEVEPQPLVLDWSGNGVSPRAGVGDLADCSRCGRPTLLRHPETRLPCHKTCVEQQLAEARP